MGTMRRAILMILDSVGCGELPDADRYGDEGSDTLGHIAERVGGLNLPGLQRLGLGNIASIKGVEPSEDPAACYGKMTEVSAGKDSTTGHWEMMGLRLDKPFPTYPDGFPSEVMRPFAEAAGREALGNRTASGTAIIEELGGRHVETGRPIVYTSADSVFQIAAHEEVIPIEELYELCRVARERILTGEHAVGRVIARPFVGEADRFQRMAEHRRDFSLQPRQPTLLDRLKESGRHTYAVGKVEDIFAGRGIDEAIHTADNMETVDRTLEAMRTRREPGLIFANCVDFDSKWGHRNEPEGYARELEAFDRRLPELLESLNGDDMLIITADHGNDPTTPSTDHSREYVPILVTVPAGASGVELGVRATFSDVAATLADVLDARAPEYGTSFRRLLGV